MTANRATTSAKTSLLRGTTEPELEARRRPRGRAPGGGCGALGRLARRGNSLAIALPLTHSRRHAQLGTDPNCCPLHPIDHGAIARCRRAAQCQRDDRRH